MKKILSIILGVLFFSSANAQVMVKRNLDLELAEKDSITSLLLLQWLKLHFDGGQLGQFAGQLGHVISLLGHSFRRALLRFGKRFL